MRRASPEWKIRLDQHLPSDQTRLDQHLPSKLLFFLYKFFFDKVLKPSEMRNRHPAKSQNLSGRYSIKGGKLQNLTNQLKKEINTSFLDKDLVLLHLASLTTRVSDSDNK